MKHMVPSLRSVHKPDGPHGCQSSPQGAGVREDRTDGRSRHLLPKSVPGANSPCRQALRLHNNAHSQLSLLSNKPFPSALPPTGFWDAAIFKPSNLPQHLFEFGIVKMAAPFETAIAMDFCVTPSEFEMPRSVVLNSRSPIDFVSCTGNDLILHLFI